MAIHQEEQPQTIPAPAVEGAPPKPTTEGEVKARGYWEQVFRRFRRDRVAVVSAIFIVLLFIVAFAGAPIAAYFLGHGPNDQNFNAIDPVLLKPVGPWSWVADPFHPGQHMFYLLGAD